MNSYSSAREVGSPALPFTSAKMMAEVSPTSTMHVCEEERNKQQTRHWTVKNYKQNFS